MKILILMEFLVLAGMPEISNYEMGEFLKGFNLR